MNITINNILCNTLGDVQKAASPETYRFIAQFLDESNSVEAHTSGSTGQPKPIRLLKSDMQASAELTNRFFSLNSHSLFHLNLSPRYIAGKMMIVRALMLGASIVEEEPSNTPLANYNGTQRISLAAFVPSQIQYLLNNPEKLAMIDAMIIGGGRLAPRLEHWLAEYGANAYLTYGMTETCSHVALAPASKIEMPFKAVGNVTFEADQRQCLIINAPQFSQPRIVTNDVVDLVDNKHFFWRGRFDNVINTGGIKVFPEEIEQKLAPLFPSIRFFITSQPSKKWGEEVVIALEYSSLPPGTLKHGNVQPALIEKMKQLLPPYSIPKKYIATKHFNETTSGKIIRKL
ncbi:MAG: AMP-binding protein [Muribaculaceae bacterium]